MSAMSLQAEAIAITDQSAAPRRRGAYCQRPRIALLIAGGPLAHMLLNGLSSHFGSIAVLREEGERKLAIVRRRARLIGLAEALGQAAFGILAKFIRRLSAARLAAIWEEHALDPRLGRGVEVSDVGSVNSPLCREILRKLAPDVVVVYGTRIIKRETRQCVAAPFINYHAGMNPKYRGQNGAYWARRERDPAHAGVTVHLIDEGVDTGDVLYQATCVFTRADNIATYQHRQMATALPLLIRAIEDALVGRLSPRRLELPSRQWFHPTLWGYLRAGVREGVW